MSMSSQSSVQPTRDQKATLGALVDVLLDKGVFLDLDLIITVADIPLIGVNLRATIAGMETMLEYGLMNEWDERVRTGARSSADTAPEPGRQPFTGDLWFHETRAGSPVWRAGTGAYDSVEGFTWKAAQDRRPAVHLRPHEITDVRTEDQSNPAGGSSVLVLESPRETVRLAGDRLGEWAVVLHDANQTSEVLDGPERG